jgi:DNA recombination protein RmuC
MDASTLVVAFVASLVGAGTVGVLVWTLVGRRVPVAPAAAEAVGPDRLAQHGAEVRHQLDRVADLVLGLSERQAVQHGEVAASLDQALRATAGLADTTAHLREALASPKARGQWGERMADDVLRLAGFVEGVNYRRQVAIAGGTIPDVTFLLPGDLVLHMDVKFPLDNHLRASTAASPAEQRAAEVAFVRDVRGRVKELATRGYVQAGVTVDHVLLFVPNEAVYGAAHQLDPTLADVALRHKVVLCSPFTLFAVLGVIRQSVEAHEVARASDEILERLAGFGHQWDRFTEQLDVVARRLDTAQRGFEELAGPRRRQLQREVDHVADLRTRRGLGSTADEGDRPHLAPVDQAPRAG